EHNKNVYYTKSKWYGSGVCPNELVFKRMRYEYDDVTVDATNVKGVYSDFKHTFKLTVSKNVMTVNCVKGIVDAL
ncbi:23370_t:CDS:2, partial [Racocetra persica]